MAHVTRTDVIITDESGQKKQVKRIVLALTENEAFVVKMLTGAVGGSHVDTWRKHTDAVYYCLDEFKLEPSELNNAGFLLNQYTGSFVAAKLPPEYLEDKDDLVQPVKQEVLPDGWELTEPYSKYPNKCATCYNKKKPVKFLVKVFTGKLHVFPNCADCAPQFTTLSGYTVIPLPEPAKPTPAPVIEGLPEELMYDGRCGSCTTFAGTVLIVATAEDCGGSGKRFNICEKHINSYMTTEPWSKTLKMYPKPFTYGEYKAYVASKESSCQNESSPSGSTKASPETQTA